MTQPAVAGIGTAVPGHPVRQSEIQDFAANLFQDNLPNLERLMPVFANTCIQSRYLAQPLEWYGRVHTFAEANALYEEKALALAAEAATTALKEANVDPGHIGIISFVSSTGIATPTVDSKLIAALGLPPQTVRVPLWGLGCAGGVAGMARTAELVKATGKSALMIAVELCSLTFQRNDFSKANLVGASIFGDGAAAVVITPDGRGPALLASHSTLFPQTEDIMGWDVTETGLKVRFSRDIPSLVRDYLPGLVEEACRLWGLARQDMKYFVAHPGGVKVLAAYAESLRLEQEQLLDAWRVLANYGNMSSATVIFALAEFLRRQEQGGRYGIMAALGPGFCAEQVLFRW